MGLEEGVYWAVNHLLAKFDGNKNKTKDFCGISWGTICNLIERSTSPKLDNVAKIVDKLDDDAFINFVKTIRPNLNVSFENMEGKHEVPAFDIGDINTVFATVADPKTRESLPFVLTNLQPIFRLQIPDKFFPSDFSVRVIGHSMEPDIPSGAAVGLTMLKADRDFVAGEIYLCRLPYEGLVLRRVVVAPGQDALEFQALHNDRDAYRSQIMHPDEALPLVFARLRWVAFRK